MIFQLIVYGLFFFFLCFNGLIQEKIKNDDHKLYFHSLHLRMPLSVRKGFDMPPVQTVSPAAGRCKGTKQKQNRHECSLMIWSIVHSFSSILRQWQVYFTIQGVIKMFVHLNVYFKIWNGIPFPFTSSLNAFTFVSQYTTNETSTCKHKKYNILFKLTNLQQTHFLEVTSVATYAFTRCMIWLFAAYVSSKYSPARTTHFRQRLTRCWWIVSNSYVGIAVKNFGEQYPILSQLHQLYRRSNVFAIEKVVAVTILQTCLTVCACVCIQVNNKLYFRPIFCKQPGRYNMSGFSVAENYFWHNVTDIN